MYECPVCDRFKNKYFEDWQERNRNVSSVLLMFGELLMHIDSHVRVYPHCLVCGKKLHLEHWHMVAEHILVEHDWPAFEAAVVLKQLGKF